MSDSIDADENDANVGFLFKAMRNRDPRKRRVKPVSRHLLQVNFGDDDSDNDSDYHVSSTELSDGEKERVFGSDMQADDEDSKDVAEAENGKDGSAQQSDNDTDDDDDSIDDDDDDDDDADDDSDDGSDDESDESEEEIGVRSKNLWDAIDSDDDDDEDYVPKKKQKHAEKHYIEKQRIRSPEVKQVVPPEEETKQARPMKVLICCVCLGDISSCYSETDDEIVECDNCGVAVHEGCYGISDNQSAASTESSASTEPWFCDACKAGVKADCELCPNEGGIFKETDAGKWVHLVCALYTPGVAFGDVDKLSPVTLFEMPYAKWGFKECSLCEDARFSRTGVCVSCDAGMCRSYFHVTCAQRNGLLSEASPDEDIADPFYAYCKLHADKTAARAKRRNWLAIQSHVRQHAATDILDEKEKARFKRKLNRHRQKYLIAKAIRPPAWVPPQKMMRFLTSSPSAVKKMLKKAELMGIITQTQHVTHTAEKQEKRKNHIAPAMSAEFITYYLDRNVRLEKLKCDMKDLEKQNSKLCQQDNQHRHQYDQLMKESSKIHETSHKLRREGEKLWSLLSDLAGKPLPLPDILKQKKSSRSPTRKEIPKSPPAVINVCGICEKTCDQHLLARCDKCHLWYHLGCLDPPLTRMPKKTSRMGWQCSQCTEFSSDDSEGSSTVNVNAPRRLREKIKEPAKLSHAKRDMEFLFPKGQNKKAQQKKKSRGKKPPLKKETKKAAGEEEMLVVLLDGATADVKEVMDDAHTTPRDVKHVLDDAHTTLRDSHMTPHVKNIIDDTHTTPNDAHTQPRDVPPTPRVKDLVDDAHMQPRTPSDAVAISDDSSMEVEVKIIEQTTPIPKQHPQFQDVSRTGRKIIKKKHYDEDEDSSDVSPKLPPSSGSGKKSPEKELARTSRQSSATPKKLFGSQCVTCAGPGDRTNMVSCDVCEQCYHFACLNPPHKKTPKQRGYTWHCEACDTGSDESDEEEED